MNAKTILKTRTETPKGAVTCKVEDEGHMARFRYYYPHTPSWKTPGSDDGSAIVEVVLHRPTGTVEFDVEELTNSGRGCKRTMVSIDKDAAKALAQMLKEVV